MDGWSVYERLGMAIGLAALVSAIYLFFRFQLGPSLKLLTLYRAGRPHGGIWRAAARVLSILAEAPIGIFQQKTLFKLVRMEVEIECLCERPVREVGERAGDFNARLRRWRAERAELRGAECVALAHAGKIQDRAEELDRYFDALTRLQRKEKDFRFAIKVHIGDGFVAPLHLVAGMLSKFDEDWAKIIRTYEADHNTATLNDTDNNTIAALRDLREIQKFIFDCWLQWGPSIPLCAPSCGNFGGAWTSLQYGYGDENNSIELVGSRAHLAEYWAGVKHDRPHVLAVRADVKGHIASTRFFADTNLPLRIGRGLAESWSAVDRTLLLLSEEDAERTSDKEGEIATAIGDKKVGVVTRHNGAANYYSAYLWIIFVVLREKLADGKSIWVPANRAPDQGKQSAAPWLDFIPFFEHGNIADEETFLFLKKQLARKAVTGLAQLVKDYEAKHNAAGAYPLRFAFACSLDHPGCGAKPEFVDDAALAASLRRLAQQEVAASPVLKDIVLFDDYTAVHPHASCTLPFMVTRYFERVHEISPETPESHPAQPRFEKWLRGALTGGAKKHNPAVE
jgi:hypothetical protein